MNLKKHFHNNIKNLIMPSGIIVLVLAVVLSILTGSLVSSPFRFLKDLFDSGDSSTVYSVLLYVRLPRTVACVAAGAALSVAGAILQKVLANKLASPGIVGVNAGAGLGVTLCCALGVTSGIVYSLSAFIGSLFAVIIITYVAKKSCSSSASLILGGVAVNAFLNAASEAVCVLSDDAALMSVDFRVGGFSSVSYIKLVPAVVVIAVALTILFTLINDLDVLTMGDGTASGLGMNIRKTKNTLLILSSLMAGAAVSFSGLLGFVGLVVPHFVRKMFPGNTRKLIIGSAVFGSAFLTLSDMLARVIFAPYELPVGIIMAFVGGPFFVMLLINGRGGEEDA